jgi:hypothetical protein
MTDLAVPAVGKQEKMHAIKHKIEDELSRSEKLALEPVFPHYCLCIYSFFMSELTCYSGLEGSKRATSGSCQTNERKATWLKVVEGGEGAER